MDGRQAAARAAVLLYARHRVFRADSCGRRLLRFTLPGQQQGEYEEAVRGGAFLKLLHNLGQEAPQAGDASFDS